MIKILTGAQMREIDKKAVENLKIPGIILMENAGRLVYEQVAELQGDNNAEILIICGKGNNGGDGFVAARHLIQNEFSAQVISLFQKEELSPEALMNLNILENFAEIQYFDEMNKEDFEEMVFSAEIIVDGILGAGINSPVKGKIREVVEIINKNDEGTVISIDIPSGVSADTGEILGTAVKADYTVTFFAPKLGSILYPGAEYSGEIVVDNIGIPEYLLDNPELNVNLVTENYVFNVLPPRNQNSHKGTFGSVFNVAGSFGMTGAAYLCAVSSLAVGAGYSTLAAPKSIIPVIASMAPELVFLPLGENNDNFIFHQNISEVLDKSQKCNSFLIGPGIGTHPSTVDFVLSFTKEITDRGLKAVFDADALNCLAISEDFVLPLNSVITPHPLELSRLIRVSPEEILYDRIKAARTASEKFNTIVVLKGARTVIACPDGRVYINPVGNSALAKAGTGDVLSGMIAGFIAQGVDIKNAAILGTYIHGLAGNIAGENLTEYSVFASNLINYIPVAIKNILTNPNILTT